MVKCQVVCGNTVPILMVQVFGVVQPVAMVLVRVEPEPEPNWEFGTVANTMENPSACGNSGAGRAWSRLERLVSVLLPTGSGLILATLRMVTLLAHAILLIPRLSWWFPTSPLICCFLVISYNSGFRQKHPGVPDGSDGSDGTAYPLTESYTLPVTQATGGIAYVPPLLCGDVNAPSEGHMCYTFRRGCSNAEAVHTMPGDVKS